MLLYQAIREANGLTAFVRLRTAVPDRHCPSVSLCGARRKVVDFSSVNTASSQLLPFISLPLRWSTDQELDSP